MADTEAGATRAILKTLFESIDHAKTNAAQQYSTVNRRVVVKLLRNGDPVPMDVGFTKDDIIEHVIPP